MANLKFREFTTGSDLRTSLGSSASRTWDAQSMFFLLRPDDQSNYQPILYGDGNRIDAYYDPTVGGGGTIRYDNTAGDVTPPTTGAFALPTTSGQVIFGFTKSAGGTMRWHKYVHNTGLWAHGDNGSAGDPTMSASGSLRHFSGNGEGWQFVGGAALGAVWNVDLAATDDLTVESLKLSLEHWSTVPPVHLWRYDQATITDPYGGANETVNSGSTIGADSFLVESTGGQQLPPDDRTGIPAARLVPLVSTPFWR